MLKITAPQVAVLTAYFQNAFARRMVEHLRQNFGPRLKARGVEDARLPPVVRSAIADGIGYGIVEEEDLQAYLECIPALGPGFDRKFPEATAVLERTTVDGTAKMKAMKEEVLPGLAAKVG